MKYRKLGNTDLLVSEISLGCSGYWGNRRFTENRAIAIVQEAFERGVNFFDTGHNYCNFNAEPRLGRAVRKLLTGNGRSRLVISTKAGTVIPSASLFPSRRSKQKNFSPDHIEQSCAKSIKNLNCDYLDIFHLHGITESEFSEPLRERLFDMKRLGMYRYLGVNTHTFSDMDFVSRHPEYFDLILIDYNVLQLDREPIITRLSDAGIGVVAGTVLGQGHLVRGKIGSLNSAADIWYLARAILKPTGRLLAKASSKMKDTLASVPGMSPSQAAFAYILENPAIASCVFGTTSILNLIDILGASEKNLDECSRLAIRNTFTELQNKISE
jgi:aryl-alcohol dehydrogenase-like predicted oxidoreductase